MKFFTTIENHILVCLILKVCLTVDALISICRKPVPVELTRMTWKTKMTSTTYRSFWGQVRHRTSVQHYMAPEIYYVTQIRIVCCDGYTGPIHRCEPVCSPDCPDHSHCVRPNECQCIEGYENLPLEGCSPKCSQDCPTYAYCAEPEKCECETDYKMVSGGICEPTCEPNCGNNSYCRAPNLCDCAPGYAQKIDQDCSPVCENCGDHSTCIKPNECQCDQGYASTTGTNCLPSCSQGCPKHGYCAEPEKCECETGYNMTSGGVCEPSCEPKCADHSYCKEPNTCECFPGFERNNNGPCFPICTVGCSDYGFCVQPNVCECYPGYASVVELPQYDCKPKCRNECNDGFCFAPDTCKCHDGYLMGSNNTCEPQCHPPCMGGECTGRDVCTCGTGFQSIGHICEPICEPSCQNGVCLAPNFCMCSKGYEPEDLIPSKCRPHCEAPCENATCTAPNLCSCNEGYVRENNSLTSCKPDCRGCENGDCVSPGECKCWPGFERINENCDTMSTMPIDKNQISATTEAIAIIKVTETANYQESTKIIEYTTEIIDLSTNGDVDSIDRPTISCLSKCQCWIYVDGWATTNNSKCTDICGININESCLNLSNCHCNALTNYLVCNATKTNHFDSHLVEINESRYACHAVELVGDVLSQTNSAHKWPIVIGICVVVCVAIATLTALYKLFRKSLSHEENEEILL